MTMQENSSNPPSVQIGGTDITRVTYKGEQVVTFVMIDKVHKRPEGTAKDRFNSNRQRFVEGDDFVLATAAQKYEFHTFGIDVPNRGLTLITRRGYLKIVKSLNDDLAWQVFDEMIERYFAMENRAVAPVQVPTTAEAFYHAFRMIADAEKRQAEQQRAIAALEDKVDRVEKAQTVMSKRPANAEGITHIRTRIGRMFGLSGAVIDEVMRQSPYAPKPAGMVRNDHVEADGALYAVCWQKDVTATFSRFVDECHQATPFLFQHPYIEGRFKVAKKEIAA